jgi:hypothetical protein
MAVPPLRDLKAASISAFLDVVGTPSAIADGDRSVAALSAVKALAAPSTRYQAMRSADFPLDLCLPWVRDLIRTHTPGRPDVVESAMALLQDILVAVRERPAALRAACAAVVEWVRPAAMTFLTEPAVVERALNCATNAASLSRMPHAALMSPSALRTWDAAVIDLITTALQAHRGNTGVVTAALMCASGLLASDGAAPNLVPLLPMVMEALRTHGDSASVVRGVMSSYRNMASTPKGKACVMQGMEGAIVALGAHRDDQETACSILTVFARLACDPVFAVQLGPCLPATFAAMSRWAGSTGPDSASAMGLQVLNNIYASTRGACACKSSTISMHAQGVRVGGTGLEFSQVVWVCCR